jgi:hypothetical protein
MPSLNRDLRQKVIGMVKYAGNDRKEECFEWRDERTSSTHEWGHLCPLVKITP